MSEQPRITPELVAASALACLRDMQERENTYWQRMLEQAAADRKAWWDSLTRWQKAKHRAGRAYGRVVDYLDNLRVAIVDLGRAIAGRDLRESDW